MSSRRILLTHFARSICRAKATTISSGVATASPLSLAVSRPFSTEAKPLIPGVGRGKTSTGLVGLPVDHDAVPKMIVKYQALLDRLAESDMPEDALYRINIEKIARYRIKAAQENIDDPDKVEELCNCGQVEELVLQADNEMKVMEMYIRNRWWEYVKPVDVEHNPDPEKDHGDIDWGAGIEKNTGTEEKK